MTQKTLALALGLALGSLGFGAAQAQEEGIRPIPDDIAAQTDERTEDTMPYPQDSLQGADTPVDKSVQDAVAGDEDALPLMDESDSETASTDISLADEAAAEDALADTSEDLPATTFARADLDSDGALTAGEVTALNDATLDFAKLDADGDGSVSVSEWSATSPSTVAEAEDE